jgi:two-component system chemotaxis response regulator CheB
VYVAPPDHHLLVSDGHVELTKTPRENGHRPAIDPTMRSAARHYDGGTVGVVLSGSRDDGTMGLAAIKAAGGLAVAQEPTEALYSSMPTSAIENVDVDAVLSLERIPDWIMHQREPGHRRHSDIEDPQDQQDGPHPPGEGTRFTCPDCGGVLFERHEGNLERFQCSVGHVFSIESLSSAQAEALEGALWAAVRSLEDRASLLGRLATRARGHGHPRSADTFERQAREALERAATIREAIQGSSDDESIAAES